MPLEKSLLTESSIHGLRFMSDSTQSKLVRIFWALAFVTSIVGMSYYAKGIFYRWINQPDIGQLIRSHPIRNIPWPAVTICTPLIAKRDYVNYGKFTKIQMSNGSLDNEFSSEEQKRLAAVLQACQIKESSLSNIKLEENPSESVKYLQEGKNFN